MAKLDRAPKAVHVVRLGAAAAGLHWYLRGHEDSVSWTSDVREAIPFLTADAAKRYAARRLGGAWHVAEVDRAGFRRVVIDDEGEAWPEAGVASASPDRAPLAVILTREQGDARMAHRRAMRLRATSPWAA